MWTVSEVWKRVCGLLGIGAVLLIMQGCLPIFATGVATGILLVDDRREPEVLVVDEALEWRLGSFVQKNMPKGTHVNATSYNGVVLLTGEVLRPEDKRDLELFVQGHKNVRRVANHVRVSPPSALLSRAMDTTITAGVKSRLFANVTSEVSTHRIKVVTEDSTVYLMGLLTPAEAEHAKSVVRRTRGVEKVVTVFEILPGP